ncbi:MAG: glutathione peroxidase [Hyphomicrobiales bacterium]|nr:glutathione peroxidase [Hyphomicrobiales bacterium]
MTRRSFSGFCGAGLVAGMAGSARAAVRSSGETAYVFSFAGLNGGRIRLARFAGKPFMVVNTASHCGFTPQLAGLEALYKQFGRKGFAIIGVPSNDFHQEPGDSAAIAKTAEGDYHVTFPLAAKVHVVGDKAAPFYKWAAAQRPRDVPQWNFHKYLIGADGYIAAVFPTTTVPQAPEVLAAISRQLGGAA